MSTQRPDQRPKQMTDHILIDVDLMVLPGWSSKQYQNMLAKTATVEHSVKALDLML